jgi:hypothetical protein
MSTPSSYRQLLAGLQELQTFIIDKAFTETTFQGVISANGKVKTMQDMNKVRNVLIKVWKEQVELALTNMLEENEIKDKLIELEQIKTRGGIGGASPRSSNPQIIRPKFSEKSPQEQIVEISLHEKKKQNDSYREEVRNTNENLTRKRTALQQLDTDIDHLQNKVKELESTTKRLALLLYDDEDSNLTATTTSSTAVLAKSKQQQKGKRSAGTTTTTTKSSS